MTVDRSVKISAGIIAGLAVITAAQVASTVVGPLALALFIIAVVWPLQWRLQSKMPQLLALAITILITVAVCLAFASLVVWGFTRVGRSLIADAARYQVIYDNAVAWLLDRGISVAGLWAEHFDTRWILDFAHRMTGMANTTLTFWLITLTYVVLGLLEVNDVERKVRSLSNPNASRILLAVSAETAVNFRKYMLVRTQMSVITGALVWFFAWAVGLQFAAEWGVIAFALNYIPFIGPFIATLFPTLLAMTQFETWEAVLGIFACLNAIQFVVGSYIEPRVSGGVLSISPTVVLFAVFFWTYLWGLFGAFIGVPIVIAALTFCRHYQPAQWVAHLFGGMVETGKPGP